MKNGGISISDEYLKSKLAQKGLIRLKDDHPTVFSLASSAKDPAFMKSPVAAALGAEIAGAKFNKNIIMLNGRSAGPGMKGVLEARLSALHLTIANCGLKNTYFYFRQNWPHLSLNGEFDEEKNQKQIKNHLEKIIVKLCCSELIFYAAIAKELEVCLPAYKTVAVGPSRKASVEIAKIEICCAFHSQRAKDIFILASEVPICSGCRTRLVNAYHKKVLVRGASEEEIKLWLGAQAMGDEN